MLNAKAKKTLALVGDVADDVSWCVVGGVAVSVYADRNPTDDVDILVKLSGIDFPAFVNRFVPHRYGADLSAIVSNRPGLPPRGAQLVAFDPTLTPLDILITGDDSFLSKAVSGAKPLRVGDISVPVIGRIDLIEMKRLCGREKDLSDITAMTQHEKAGILQGEGSL